METILLIADATETQRTSFISKNDTFSIIAGYFLHAKGKERVLIIREEGAKLPADVGGISYIPLKDRTDISSIHAQVRRFLEKRL